MKVYVLIYTNNDYRDIGGIFASKAKLDEHLNFMRTRFPGTTYEIEEHTIFQ